MSKRGWIIMIVAISLMLVIVGAGFVVVWSRLAALTPNVEETPEPDTGETEISRIGPLFPLKTFVVNLADNEGKRYLRITMDLELSDEKIRDEITGRLPQIRDKILMILPSKKVDDIRSAEGKNQLRNEITTEINKLLSSGDVNSIYFTEFVIQ